jgi:hypothetical protein
MLRTKNAENLTLVHGRISTLPFPVYPHAWIEIADGQVYDPVLDKLEPATLYAAKRSAVVERRYSQIEMARLAAETGHSGPWHDGVRARRLGEPAS